MILGDDSSSEHRLVDILPVYRRRRARLEVLVDERVADSAATEWGDLRSTACGLCAVCEEQEQVQVQSHRDLLLVAGLRVTQRARLLEAGIFTIEQLAPSTAQVRGLSQSVIAALREQAVVQLSPGLAWRVVSAAALAAIPDPGPSPSPSPSPGDIFFDFEGDPPYQGGTEWGLDYLFGLVETDETFRAFWAHDLAQEK